MKYFSILFLSFLGLTACQESESANENTDAFAADSSSYPDPYTERYGEEIDHELFTIKLSIEEPGVDHFYLVAETDIAEGSFILSHYADPGMSGRYLFVLDENQYLSIDHVLTETPGPVEEAYYWSEDQPEKKLKGDQIIRQLVQVKTEGDFEVNGKVTFVVEPSCHLWVTPFTIISESGEIKVSQEDSFDSSSIGL